VSGVGWYKLIQTNLHYQTMQQTNPQN